MPKLYSIRTFPRKTPILRKVFSSQFRTSSATVFAFCWSSLGWGCQSHLLRVLWKILRVFFELFFLSLSVKDTDWKNFSQKHFDGVVKTAIQVSIGKELGSFFQAETLCFLIHFGHGAKIFRPSGKSFMAKMQKMNFTCPYEQFADLFREKIHPFWFWGEFYWPHTKLFFPGFSELQSTCPKEPFEESFSEKKPPFHDTCLKNFALLLNLVQRCCQNCIIRVHRETLGWDSFMEKCVFSIFYRLWAKKFGPSDRILMAEFWKLHPTCH